VPSSTWWALWTASTRSRYQPASITLAWVLDDGRTHSKVVEIEPGRPKQVTFDQSSARAVGPIQAADERRLRQTESLESYVAGSEDDTAGLAMLESFSLDYGSEPTPLDWKLTSTEGAQRIAVREDEWVFDAPVDPITAACTTFRPSWCRRYSASIGWCRPTGSSTSTRIRLRSHECLPMRSRAVQCFGSTSRASSIADGSARTGAALLATRRVSAPPKLASKSSCNCRDGRLLWRERRLLHLRKHG
jgi:hypothetical protein